MSDRITDEQELVEFILGRCEASTADQIRRRLAEDRDYAAAHEAIRGALGLLKAWEAPEPPSNLAERTMARVRAMRRTESLAARTPARRSFTPAFSLRDLAALAVAAMLVMGILIPSMRQASRRGDQERCSANQGEIGEALSRYAMAHGEALPASPSDTEAWLPQAGRSVSNSAGLFQLVNEDYARPNLFQCPAAGGRSFQKAAGMIDFPSRGALDYSFQHSVNSPVRLDDPELRSNGAKREMAILADATPVFAGGRFQPDRVNQAVSDNHDSRGQNVLYLDMHVGWTEDSHVGVRGNNIWLAEGVSAYTGRERPAGPTDTFLLPYGGN